MARTRSTRSKKSSPGVTALGCGLLIVILVVISAIGNACSGGDEEVPATQFAPLTTLAPRPTTTRPAPTTTTTTTTARPAPAPDPDPDPDADRDRRAPAPAPAPARAEDNDDDGGSAYYPNCAAVRTAGKAPIRRGDPGYSRDLDRDGDGEGCAGD
jgi:hypothetical protein